MTRRTIGTPMPFVDYWPVCILSQRKDALDSHPSQQIQTLRLRKMWPRWTHSIQLSHLQMPYMRQELWKETRNVSVTPHASPTDTTCWTRYYFASTIYTDTYPHDDR